MSDLRHSTTRQALKTYRCNLCGTTILPGDTYRHQTILTDGHFHTWRDCTPCGDVINHAICDGYEHEGDGIDADDAQEWAEDHPNNPHAVAFLERFRP